MPGPLTKRRLAKGRLAKGRSTNGGPMPDTKKSFPRVQNPEEASLF